MKAFIRKTGILILMAIFLPSCSEYLNVVPDSTLKLENIFSTKVEAWNGLSKVYSYMPDEYHQDLSSWLLGDEWINNINYDMTATAYRPIRIMRGLQDIGTAMLGYWSGTGGGKPLYQAIRQANVFLENIDLVKDLEEIEKKEWIAQVKFLKAYYYFLLLQRYGPIIINDELVSPDAMAENLFHQRAPVEDCFNLVLRLMDEAIPDLKERVGSNELGQVDKVAATAIKARVLLFRASPFFNGNKDYQNFLDHNKQPFFPQEEDREKWKDVIDAVEEAITVAKSHGLDLYTYEGAPYLYDAEDYEHDPQRMQTLYTLRLVVCEPWNRELLWGLSNLQYTSESNLAFRTAIRLPTGYGQGYTNNTNFSRQEMGATYRMLERYYTKNGIPVDEDKTIDRSSIYDIVTTPGIEDPEYDEFRGLMQPGAKTINLYLNREPRFYANLGITGGYWRAHFVRINTMMFAGTDGGYSSSFTTNYIHSGIGIQKLVHPESTSGNWQRVIRYPFPVIRMADLYLMKAEALNEYYGSSQDVYDAINIVRRRAGIPDVETVWSNSDLVRTVNHHLTKEGMREIILRERSIEFAFEGIRYWDVVRHKKAFAEFLSPVSGWTYSGTNAETFFVRQVMQSRKFSIRDYLWPIDLNEMNTNGRLIQNPGW
jgi:hypothetical protein